MRSGGKILLEDLGCSEDEVGLSIPPNTGKNFFGVPGMILVWLPFAGNGMETAEEDDCFLLEFPLPEAWTGVGADTDDSFLIPLLLFEN